MIIVVFGLPGTGKSYFSQQLAEEISADYVNTDRVRQRMNKLGKYDDKTRKLVYDHLMKEMTDKLKASSNVVVDGTFHEKSKREMIKSKAVELGQKAVFIELKSPEHLVKRRLKKRQDYSEADFKVYQQIKEKFEPYKKPHLLLRSNNRNIDELIERTKNSIYG